MTTPLMEIAIKDLITGIGQITIEYLNYAYGTFGNSVESDKKLVMRIKDDLNTRFWFNDQAILVAIRIKEKYYPNRAIVKPTDILMTIRRGMHAIENSMNHRDKETQRKFKVDTLMLAYVQARSMDLGNGADGSVHADKNATQEEPIQKDMFIRSKFPELFDDEA